MEYLRLSSGSIPRRWIEKHPTNLVINKNSKKNSWKDQQIKRLTTKSDGYLDLFTKSL